MIDKELNIIEPGIIEPDIIEPDIADIEPERKHEII